MQKVLRSGGILVIAIAAVLGWKYWNKSSDSDSVKAEAAEAIRGLPEYSKDAKYYDSLLQGAHERAFESAYSMGGRRRSAKLDTPRYLHNLFVLMSEQAERDGRSDAHKVLQDQARRVQAAAATAAAADAEG